MKTKISLINLGCPKNLVDSEIILGLLKEAGLEICDDVINAQVLLINTCAFIEEAKEESIDLILKLAHIKKESPQKYLVVIGCLVQRYLPELVKELPEVDLWVTLPEIPQIPKLINALINPSPCPSGTSPHRREGRVRGHFLYDHTTPRCRITPPHYAYVKIAEGCSHYCSYCAIPNIKGHYRSRPINSIFIEVKELVNPHTRNSKSFGVGAKEIILIAQDTTSYGMDLVGKPNLVQLLKRICTIDNLKWLRILYTHPAYITEELIEEIAKQPKICKYVDLPLQHIDDEILYRMKRKVNSQYIRRLLKMIRNQIPDVVLRTSLIVGFPGETEEKFQTLLEFMEEFKFERLGMFTYSPENGTPAYNMSEQVPEKIKQKRFHKAMQLQQAISREVNRSFLDKTVEVIVEGISEENGNFWYGRSYADAPEVDGLVYINPNGSHIYPGDIIHTQIVDTMEYDLVGEIRSQKTENRRQKTQYLSSDF